MFLSSAGWTDIQGSKCQSLSYKKIGNQDKAFVKTDLSFPIAVTAHFTFFLLNFSNSTNLTLLYTGVFVAGCNISPFNTCIQFCSRLQFAQTKMCLKRDIMRHWNLPSLNYINLPADKKAKVVKNKTGVNISHYTLIFTNFEYWLIDFLY